MSTRILSFMLALSGISLLGIWGYGASSCPKVVTDVYKFQMNIYTPRIYDNMASQGYRKYTKDKLVGELWMTYRKNRAEGATLSVTNLQNKSHVLGGKNVSYVCYIDDIVPPTINLIGNNKTNKFKTPSVAFALICDPSYNIGGVEEDNSLYITLGGRGTVSKSIRAGGQVIDKLSGNLGGTLGCGCSEYGHISPTRVNGVCGPLDIVDDVAAVWGTWTAKYKLSFVRY